MSTECRRLEGLVFAQIKKQPNSHGVGLDNVDVLAATDLGIWVVNTPEANSESVAEHFLVLALMLSKKVPQTMRALVQGDWESRNVYMGHELLGKTIGIVGFGRVGQAIGRICYRAFASRILYYDLVRWKACEVEINAQSVSLDDLLRESDYVSLNLPLVPETNGLIGDKEFSLMKRSAFTINTSRGHVWKEAALLKALREGWIAGAGSDVFEQEPPTPDNPLFELENFVATPHNAAHTEEAMQRMAMVAEDILIALNGGVPQYAVNQPKKRI